jgi:glutamate--cysteine ligase catalytic subunit
MEVQPTDFENAAFAVFIVLLSRAILHYSLNFYIPISKVRCPSYDSSYVAQHHLKVDENMRRAQRRDASRTESFFFRKDVFPIGVPSPLSTPLSSPHSSGVSSPIEPNGANGTIPRKPRKLQNCFGEVPKPESCNVFGAIEDEYGEFSINEVFNGKVCSSAHFGQHTQIFSIQYFRAKISLDCLVLLDHTWKPLMLKHPSSCG